MLHFSACCLLPVHESCLSYKLYVTAALSCVFCSLHAMVPAVVDKVSGGVYLEGHLERGIVPEESVWEHGGGVGENGCLLYLHKMNLQLLRK